MTKRLNWSAPVSDAVAQRRAGGRRAYNSWRRDMAIIRRAHVATLLLAGRRQYEIAAELGVARSTICKDVAALVELANREHECPVCGQSYVRK